MNHIDNPRLIILSIIRGLKEMESAREEIKQLYSQSFYDGYDHAMSHFEEILISAHYKSE
ncbi:hypothetical protein [Bacillus atrophaeus]|uniref:hypothetical protein n=1 Tax=Bacillus atrophaeus TaxID=1452 RepID=UPI002E1F6A6B|nr:hypothetical protein [Bacillus atrophaeus]